MSNLNIGQIGSIGDFQGMESVKKNQGTGFGEVLKESVAAVNGQMHEAKALSDDLVSGQSSNIHETMIAMEKSSISFKLLTKVQVKAVEAYKEVMRIQL